MFCFDAGVVSAICGDEWWLGTYVGPIIRQGGHTTCSKSEGKIRVESVIFFLFSFNFLIGESVILYVSV